jgi:hypothetical protein
MTASRDQPQRAANSAKSRAAEKARLEAKLADNEVWTSLQALRQRKPGKGLMDAIGIISERERLENELMQTSEDYRAWAALAAPARKSGGAQAAPPAVFKTRVRVKAGAASSVDPALASAPTSAAASAPAERTSARDERRARLSTASVPTTAGRGRTVVEEASVTIVRRAKDGTETRIELAPTGVVQNFDDPAGAGRGGQGRGDGPRRRT